WLLPAEAALARPEPAPWPLAALMSGANEAMILEVAERIARTYLPLAERGELTGLLAVLAGMRLPPGAVANMVRRSPMLRELVRELGVAEIFEPEAAARGESRCVVAGMRELVQTRLERRFGVLRADELAALEAADAPLLRQVAVQVLDAGRAEIRRLLGLPSGL
ncbi:MAG TPA: hypothetical protein VGP33_08355, partial [Chloroflexota bacterium]|nr:hypothetical protein [Chloroflexota bacterium]